MTIAPFSYSTANFNPDLRIPHLVAESRVAEMTSASLSYNVPLSHRNHVAKLMNSALLLIDDNAVQAATRQAILRRAGYFVVAALSPKRALDQLQRNEFQQEIGLVITDHFMPEMTGAEFVRSLRKTHLDLPVLVISGMDDIEDQYEGLNVSFRLKPLPPENLLSTVQTLLTAHNSVR